MKTNTLLNQSAMRLVAASVLLCGSVHSMLNADPVAMPAPGTARSPSTRIVIIDDQSGPELATEGIRPLSLEAMESLVTESLEARSSVFLAHIPVDDDASDNPVAEFSVNPYPGGAAPVGPSARLQREELRKAMAEYQIKRAEWMRGFREYRRTTDARSETFLEQVMRNQLEINKRMDQILLERRGKDFRRSDQVGVITRASQLLGANGTRYLVANSDCVDAPGKRAARRTPLTPQELDPGIVLIFVNTTGNAQKAALFRGLKNPVLSAPDLETAFRMVFKRPETQRDSVEAGVVPQSVTQ